MNTRYYLKWNAVSQPLGKVIPNRKGSKKETEEKSPATFLMKKSKVEGGRAILYFRWPVLSEWGGCFSHHHLYQDLLKGAREAAAPPKLEKFYKILCKFLLILLIFIKISHFISWTRHLIFPLSFTSWMNFLIPSLPLHR